MNNTQINDEYIQGTQAWLDLRKTKITATDACIIMNESKWKTRIQLYKEKISNVHNNFCTPAMQRGIDLEPLARELYSLKTGIFVEPKVIVKDWAMASLDGISECGNYLIEIKCPGQKDHEIALSGKIPSHYFPQLQHQMWVCDVEKMHYFSFDGTDGVIVEILKDPIYLERLISEELKFFEYITNKNFPESNEEDFMYRTDDIWVECSKRWKIITRSIKELQEEEEELRKQLIFLSSENNVKGNGISLCKVSRKGNVDYSKIPELKNIDLEKYRKESSSSWRITQE